MIPSKYQERIFTHIDDSEESALIEAVAGSGKTTTIVEGAKLVDPQTRSCFVAFNKAVADGLSKRLPPTVPARTLNSLGFRTWLKYNDGCKTDPYKMGQIVKELLPSYRDRLSYEGPVKKVVRLAKAYGMVPRELQEAHSYLHPADWKWLINTYDVGDADTNLNRLIELSSIALNKSINMASSVVDFDDQIYMPIITGCYFDQFDTLFVDEAQDINDVQRAMIGASYQGRVIAVGDSRQAIYAFRGAASNSMSLIGKEFNCVPLPLSICYRCCVSVVKEAQRIVPHIEWRPNAPEGTVLRVDAIYSQYVQPGDGIICRLNAPIVEEAYSLVRRGIGAKILGRDVGKGLVSLVEKMDAMSIDELERRLENYREREVAKFTEEGLLHRAETVNDKVSSLVAVIHGMPETKRTISHLTEVLEKMFSDKSAKVTLSTIHKAKGLEYNRVWFIETPQWPNVKDRNQEDNLRYVAITRAKDELIYVNSHT